MKRKYQLNNVGEVYMTNEGYELEIIDGGYKRGYCHAKFTYNDVVIHSVYLSIKKGSIKNKYHAAVYGVGYIGDKKYVSSINNKETKEYATWLSMIKRCYSKEYKYTTYKNVFVDASWHNFQNFAEWHENQYNPNNDFHLDKDLLSGDNKIYSPETCCLIPHYLNSFLTNKQSTNTSGVIGVCRHGNKYHAKINDGKGNSIRIGIFKTIKEASDCYQEARRNRVLKIKDKLLKEYPLLDKKILNTIK